MTKVALILAVFFISTGSHGTCLEEVASFSEKICGELATKGTRSILNVDGGLNANAEGLLNKFLGSAGIEGNIALAKESYENVLRKDLGSELQSNRECRIKMVELGQKYCSGDLVNTRLDYLRWPEGRKRYFIEASTVRPSCPEDYKKTSHELIIVIENNVVDVKVDGIAFKSRLVDDRKTILMSGEIPSEGGTTSFKNAEVRLRNDRMIEAEMDWVWKNQHGDICTGALRIANSIEQRW